VLRAVIFDFDGVITDSEMLHFDAFNRVLSRFNFLVSKQQYFKDYLGLRDIDVFEVVAEKLQPDRNKYVITELLEEKQQAFEHLVASDAGIIAGVREFLSMLSANEVPMAIYSGATLADIEMILAKAALADSFEVIVSAEQVRKGKPDPEGFLLALDRLNEKSTQPIAAGECIVIEDSHWGLEAAIAAEMHTVAVTNSYTADQLNMADTIITRLDELTMEDLHRLCG